MNFLRKNKKNIPIVFFYFFLFFLIAFFQIMYDKNVELKNFYTPGIHKHILPASVVKNLSFGFDNFLADVYWINIVQDLADWDRKNDFYIEEYRNLAMLDPQFSYPYLFGILTVASKRFPNGLNKMEPIANVGIQHLPYNWEIPFYLGTQFHLLQNYTKAFYYIEIAASRPIIPDSVYYAYTKYSQKKITGNSASKEFIKTMYDTTKSTTTKKILKQGMILSDLTQAMQIIVENYKTKFGMYPKSVDEMVEHNMIEVTPALKKEFIVTIDKNTGVVEILPKNR